MRLQVGDRVWLPCEVKPGPFSNERLTRIDLPTGPWVGFVDVSALKDTIGEGQTQVLALITAVENDHVTALVQGHALNTRQVRAFAEKVQPVVSVAP